jgi:hypothetical protein
MAGSMTDELKNAIRLVEEAGGIVMIQGDHDDMPEYNDIIQKEAEERVALEEFQKKRQESLKDMAEEFDSMLGAKNFSFEAVESMVHGHGLDIDDLEDLIHERY